MKWKMVNDKWKIQSGFTLVELLVSMGILAVIFAISTVSLSRVIPSTSQSNAFDVLLSDIKAQQTQAMTTDSSFGVHFEGISYTLFKGSTYSSSDPANFVVTLDPTVTITNTFPADQIVFSPGSGDVSGCTLITCYGLVLTNSQINKTTPININIYGATY